MQSKEEKTKPATHEAKLSVLIFLSGVSVIVLLLLFKNQIGHTLSSRDLIVMIMMFCAWLMYLFCKVDLATIKDAPIFKSGAESLIVVLGIVWFSSTIINAHLQEVKESAVALLEQYPYLLAVVFFLASSVLFSQGSTAALICPVAASLGVDAPQSWDPSLPALLSTSRTFTRQRPLQFRATTRVPSWAAAGTVLLSSITPSSFLGASVLQPRCLSA